MKYAIRKLLIASSLLLIAAGVTAQPGTWKKLCVECHGIDAKGRTPLGKALKTPDMTTAEFHDERDEARIRKSILEGRKNAQGAQVMVPYENQLTTEEIDALVVYILSLKTETQNK